MNYNLEYIKYVLKEHSHVNNSLENSSSVDNYQKNVSRHEVSRESESFFKEL